ncbi:hypothetical protein PAMP_020762 [Pampus punctatissimus]
MKIYVFFCLLYAAWTEGADIHVEGLEWEELSFQCPHKLAGIYSKYFCMDPCKTKEDILGTVISGGSSHTKRITLVDLGNGVFSVTFNQLRLSDAGKYWCGVQRPGLDTYTAVYLTVKEGTVFYATAGAVAMIIILVLAMCFGKCRKKQQQVCSNSMDLIGEREADCEHGETREEAESLKKLDPPTSASTAAESLISVKTTAVSGLEGESVDFRCEYPKYCQNNAKYFCHVDDNSSTNHLIKTDKHNQWVSEGRFSLYDNTTEAFFIVSMNKLVPEDSGTYWCGVDVIFFPDHISVIELNVSREYNLSLFLTAVIYVTAMVFVCAFTLCLLLVVKHQRSDPHQNREVSAQPTSSDYETVMIGVRAEPELHSSCLTPDCADLSASLPPPTDLCSHFTTKHRESTVTLGHGEYIDVDVPGHICQYQHLDLSQLEQHVYHSLHENSSPKDGSQRAD